MLKSGAILVFGMVFGRFLGLFREILLVKQYGTSLEADVVIALVTLPDILVALLVGQALPVVFLKRIQTMSPAEKLRFLWKMSFYFLAGFGFLALIFFLFPSGLARLILPADDQNPQFLEGLKWVVWTIPILCLNSVTRLFLQSESKFFLVGLENVIFNICIIFGIYLTRDAFNVSEIALSLTVGSFLRWFSQMMQLYFQLKKTNDRTSFGMDSMQLSLSDLRIYFVALLTGFSVQIMPIASRSISSGFVGVGSLSTFNYAFKLVELPIGLFLTVLSTILFPKLTQALLKGDSTLNRLAAQINSSLGFVFPLSIVSTFFLLALSKAPGLFSSEKLSDFSTVFTLAGIGLLTFVFRCYNEVYVMILNAKSEVNQSFRSALIAAAVGLGSCVLLTNSFGLPGTFWSLNLYYLTLVFTNRYFVRKSLGGSALVSSGVSWTLISFLCALPLGWYFLFLNFNSDLFRVGIILGFIVLALIPAFFILKHLYGIGKFINENI